MKQHRQRNGQEGIAMIIVVCIMAVLVMMSLALLLASSVMTQYAGRVKVCFVNRKSSKSEGKFPTFRSGNPHYPKETCREFSFFPLSSRKESSIHCFLPNRVIRVRLCQRLPERFAFNVMSFDSAPAPG